MKLITETHSDHIQGVLSCYDRIILQGTLPPFCYADGMTSYLYQQKIRIFDYKEQFAKPLRNEIIRNAEQIARDNGLTIEYLKKRTDSKEKRIAEILKQRGNHPGLVHIFSALELATQYEPWHDKKTHRTYLRPDTGKCLHYYFYFIHEILGLCYVRLPVWVPFRLQFYCNGHNWLASQLSLNKIPYQMIDNAFIAIEDFEKAQAIADAFSPDILHSALDDFARAYCPVIDRFNLTYHWSIMQVEYATDIVFSQQSYLRDMYDTLVRTAVHTVKPETIATFLGKKLHGNYQDEMGNRFNTRIEGTCIRHTMGPSSVKLYDKFGIILRIETTTNNVSFFEHYRRVEHRDGTSEMKIAHVKKSIYSLVPLRQIFSLVNHRYLEFLSTLDDNRVGTLNLNKIAKNVTENHHTYKGFNFFSDEDQQLFLSIVRGEYNIRGFQNKDLRKRFAGKSTGQICRVLKRLRVHGLIKKVVHSYKYHLTVLGRRVVALGLKLKELVIIPQLAVQG